MPSLVEILVDLKDDASAGFEKLTGQMGKVTGAVDLLHTALEAVVGGAIAAGIEKLVGLFAEHELAVTKLNEGLRVTGRYTEEGSHAIQDMAQRISDTTATSREAALSVSAMGAALTKSLSPEQLAQLQQAAVGLAQVGMMSVERAGSLIVRSLEGSGAMMKRWGVNLDQASTEQEKFNTIMQRFAPLFTVAQESANGLAGQFAEMKEQGLQLGESIGEVIARSLGLTDKIRSLKELFASWKKGIEDHMGVIVHWGTVVADVVEAVFTTIYNGLTNGVRVVVDSGAVLFNFGRTIGDSLILGSAWVQAKLVDLLNWVVDRINDVILLIPSSIRDKLDLSPLGHIANTAAEYVKDAKDNITGDVHAMGTAMHDMADGSVASLDRIGAAWQKVQTDLAKKPAVLPHTQDAGAGANLPVAVPQQDATQKIQELIQDQKLLDQQYKAGLIGVQAYHAGQRALRDEIAQQIIVLQDHIAHTDKTQVAYAKQLQLLEQLTGAYEKLGGATKSFGERLKEMLLGTNDPLKQAQDGLTQMADTMGGALAKGIEDGITAHQKFGEVVEKAVGQAAAAQAKFAMGRALMFTAEGIAAAIFDPGAATADFTAAAEMAVAAAAMSAIAGATGGFAGGAGGGGGGSSSSAAAQSQAVSDLAGGNVTINVPNTFTSDPAFWDALLGGLEQAGLKRVTVTAQG